MKTNVRSSFYICKYPSWSGDGVATWAPICNRKKLLMVVRTHSLHCYRRIILFSTSWFLPDRVVKIPRFGLGLFRQISSFTRFVFIPPKWKRDLKSQYQPGSVWSSFSRIRGQSSEHSIFVFFHHVRIRWKKRAIRMVVTSEKRINQQPLLRILFPLFIHYLLLL